ncbi:UDP-N-acetylmuramate dehydrogenase [Helicobacter fennelliae]|uniref:UDP-N-acetylenolpyruvoylglucosamine reductase n=1 Tax=Helicobacter fennelliae TaxID=215 RepID=A0A2X3DL25_9HELI|nr:UDP-N-acetylmuramate dehydrogenase [Helicobacter fennelliae]SQB98970.1 UDP-N-acetylenolpyruvoylglucosamine reductase [Helicobacter fennelliae]STQ84662.1 UDP-N-acetylenolpyruvoylglucosamine reductase [Helicobacter fennelliae]
MLSKTIDFATYSSLKIGGKNEVMILQTHDFSAQNLDLTLDSIHSFSIIGHAYNLLVSPKASNLVMLDKTFDYIYDCEDCIEIGAMTPSGKIYRFFKENDLFGLEFLKALPGSAGGLTKMNAGMKQYEIKDIMLSACVNGKWRDDIKLSYRNSNIQGIISAIRVRKIKGFRHHLIAEFNAMRRTHPKLPSCGSCFKNPPNHYAGKLLEEAGLRGFVYGNVALSQEHANFLVNLGDGSFDEAVELIALAQQKVFTLFGIWLEPEVKIIKEKI